MSTLDASFAAVVGLAVVRRIHKRTSTRTGTGFFITPRLVLTSYATTLGTVKEIVIAGESIAKYAHLRWRENHPGLALLELNDDEADSDHFLQLETEHPPVCVAARVVSCEITSKGERRCRSVSGVARCKLWSCKCGNPECPGAGPWFSVAMSPTPDFQAWGGAPMINARSGKVLSLAHNIFQSEEGISIHRGRPNANLIGPPLKEIREWVKTYTSIP